jgi:outer membrane protein assembly factor BamB
VALDAASGAVRWERSFESGDFHKGKRFPDRCVAGGKLYVTDGQECLVMDAASGRVLARYAPPEPAGGWSYLTSFAGKLYGTSRDGRTVFGIDAADGRALWTRRVEAGVHVPALSGRRLYLATGAGDLLCLDVRSGLEVWRRERAAPAGRSWTHAGEGRLLVVGENDEIVAVDAGDGSPAWRRSFPGAAASGLALGRGAVYLLAGSAALDLADGRTLWQPAPDAGGLCAAPTVTGGGVLSAPAGQSGLAVRGASGKLLAELPGAAGQACDGAIVVGERIFAVKGGKVLAVTCRPES